MARVFEWLFGNPPVAFERGELTLLVPWVAYGGAVLLIALVVWFLLGYRRSAGRLNRSERLPLTVVRAGAISLALLCLLRPQLVLSLVVPQENVVGVMLDDSASMSIADAGSGDERRGEVLEAAFPLDASEAPDALGPVLDEQFVTRFFRFSDSVERVPDASGMEFRGARTDVGGALAQVSEELASMPLAGIVMLTDGADTAGSGDEASDGDELESTLLELKARGVRVYPIPIGGSEFETDLEVGEPDVPARVLRGSLLEVRVPLRARGLAGRSVRLEVLDEGRIAATETVSFDRDAVETMVTVLAPVEEAGARRLRFRVAPLPGEVMTRNNERNALVEVEDRVVELLYFEGQPRWEMRFVRRAVDDDPELRVAGLLRTAEGKYFRFNLAEASELAGGFPDTREELFRYGGVVLGNVEASFFTQDQLNMLRDLVSQRGGGLLTLGGASAYSEGGYRDTALADILPLALPETPGEPAGEANGPASGQNARQPGAPIRELRVLPTRAGVAHPVVRLDSDPLANNERYLSLPMLTAENERARPKPGATVLLEGSSNEGESEPVLLFHRYGRGRVASVTVQDLWLWQMDASVSVEDQTHELLWRRLLRWLAADAPRRVEASASPQRAVVGEWVTLEARVEDERFLAVNSAVVEATVTAPDGGMELVPLRWNGEGDGEYTGAYQTSVSGAYQVEVRASGAGLSNSGLSDASSAAAEREPSSAWFEAGNVDDEFFDAEADPVLLGRIAEATGGSVFTLDEAEQLATDLSLAGSGATVVERRELWNVPALFLAIFGLLAVEWLLRSRRGLP